MFDDKGVENKKLSEHGAGVDLLHMRFGDGDSNNELTEVSPLRDAEGKLVSSEFFIVIGERTLFAPVFFETTSPVGST